MEMVGGCANPGLPLRYRYFVGTHGIHLCQTPNAPCLVLPILDTGPNGERHRAGVAREPHGVPGIDSWSLVAWMVERAYRLVRPIPTAVPKRRLKPGSTSRAASLWRSARRTVCQSRDRHCPVHASAG